MKPLKPLYQWRTQRGWAHQGRRVLPGAKTVRFTHEEAPLYHIEQTELIPRRSRLLPPPDGCYDIGAL